MGSSRWTVDLLREKEALEDTTTTLDTAFEVTIWVQLTGCLEVLCGSLESGWLLRC